MITPTDPPRCTTSTCDRPARMAIRTTRPGGNLCSTVFYDDRAATRWALPYCREHGIETITQLATVLVTPDEAPEEATS